MTTDTFYANILSNLNPKGDGFNLRKEIHKMTELFAKIYAFIEAIFEQIKAAIADFTIEE